MNISQKVDLLCERLGIPDYKLGERLGYGPEYFSNLRNGKRKSRFFVQKIENELRNLEQIEVLGGDAAGVPKGKGIISAELPRHLLDQAKKSMLLQGYESETEYLATLIRADVAAHRAEILEMDGN